MSKVLIVIHSHLCEANDAIQRLSLIPLLTDSIHFGHNYYTREITVLDIKARGQSLHSLI